MQTVKQIFDCPLNEHDGRAVSYEMVARLGRDAARSGRGRQ